MALKKYKPITNGRRNMTTLDYNRYRKERDAITKVN